MWRGIIFLTEAWFPQYRHFYATPHASYVYYSLQRREESEDQNNMTSFRQTSPKCLLQLSTNWTFEPVTPQAYVHQVHLWGFDCSAALFAVLAVLFLSLVFFFIYIPIYRSSFMWVIMVFSLISSKPTRTGGKKDAIEMGTALVIEKAMESCRIQLDCALLEVKSMKGTLSLPNTPA